MEKPRSANQKLQYQRELRGWSQRKVAEEVGTTEKRVSAWERGESMPAPFYQERLCKLFGKDAEELGFLQARLTPSSLVPASPMVDRGHVMNDWLDQAESIINLAWEAWFASRPRQATREIVKLLPNLEKTLYVSLANLSILHVKELLIRCHGLLGTICLDALQNDHALFHYIQAHQLAEDIQDTSLSVTYLALIGDVLRRQNDKTGALSRMELARDQAVKAKGVTSATRGHILQLLAYTYGDTGNEAEFERSIAEATDLLAHTGEGRDIAKEEFIPFEIYEIRGKVYRDLGKPLEAIPYLELAETSLDNTEGVTPRFHALVQISRGQALCDAGDLTSGVDVVMRGFLMAYRCHSPRQMNRVRKLLRKLESSSFKDYPQVAHLKEVVYETYLRMDLER